MELVAIIATLAFSSFYFEQNSEKLIELEKNPQNNFCDFYIPFKNYFLNILKNTKELKEENRTTSVIYKLNNIEIFKIEYSYIRDKTCHHAISKK